MMRSMLQELDSKLISKENLIHEQTGKLAEKDKVIQNNKTDLERLEKKTKMQEHKVGDQEKKKIRISYCCSYCFLILDVFMFQNVFFFSDWHPPENC